MRQRTVRLAQESALQGPNSRRLRPVPHEVVKVMIGEPVTFAADADAQEIAHELER